mgnify:CR=1 FL=1
MTDLATLPLDSGGLVPLAGMVLPSHLSGERGRNRASGLPQVAADDDRAATHERLALQIAPVARKRHEVQGHALQHHLSRQEHDDQVPPRHRPRRCCDPAPGRHGLSR